MRPDSWNIALLVHVLGALTLIGALTLTVSSLAAAWHSGSAAMTRLGYRSLLFAVLPAGIVMRVGAQWIANEEGLEDSDAAWIEIGFISSEPTFLFLIVATVLSGLAVRRSASGGNAVTLDRVATVLVSITLVAYLVALWAMTTKPV